MSVSASDTALVGECSPTTLPATSFLVQRARRESLISFEVFPPRPTAKETAWESIKLLSEAGPDYFSVTHGHGQPAGANRAMVQHLLNTTDVPVLAHLIATGSTSMQLRQAIEDLLEDGVRDLLALRGDPPKGQAHWQHQPQGINRASDMVRLIRQIEDEKLGSASGPGARPVSIAVAAYPPTGTDRDHQADLASLWEKQEAGADYAITQVFYNPEDYAQLVDNARSQGIHIPIVAGFAPLTNPKRLRRLGEISGVPVPPRLLDYLDVNNQAEQRRRGVSATLRFIDGVLEFGCPGLHLFTFNHHPTALAILDHLRIRDAASKTTMPF